MPFAFGTGWLCANRPFTACCEERTPGPVCRELALAHLHNNHYGGVRAALGEVVRRASQKR